MAKEPRLTLQTLKVLGTLAPGNELSGADIRRASKLATGTVYPILLRLEDAGWVTSRWEEIDPKEAGRPQRRFYRLTAVGAAALRRAEAESEQDSVRWRVAWA